MRMTALGGIVLKVDNQGFNVIFSEGFRSPEYDHARGDPRTLR